jgi:GST-like protein
MLHLAEKYRRFVPRDPTGYKETMEWLFWQVGNLGPMAGQHSHFWNYAPGGQDYAAERYAKEYDRCLGVLERRLTGRDWLAGEEYSIADMISWPWVLIARAMGQSLDHLPNVARWRAAIKARPAVQRGVDLGKDLRRQGAKSEAERRNLFGQTAGTAERGSQG